MKIGNTDISTFQARQLNFSFAHASMENQSEWAAGATLPYIARNKVGFSNYKVSLLVKGEDRQDIRMNCSKILQLLTVPVELTLDGFTTKFTAILNSHTENERSLNRYHILELDFIGYEHGEIITVSGWEEITVTNPGTALSPAMITITPGIGASEITLTGICYDSHTGEDLPVTIEDLITNSPVVLNGISGLITEKKEPKEAELWTLPALKPGVNTITCDHAQMLMEIQLLPIYI